MYLKALKLHGFKSFADPTQLRFEPGVTAVVGPNGCGKSNIADAIRWVLGEQSAKALRGGKMQDVIFEGADTRRPAQLCEVSLLLTECEKQLGSEFHEIEITRRGHRDGQGEYFFNGQACRLKDIQRLFMDTGIGRTSYSIMAQGQIDQILSSKPEERRAVFEEAAGITRYKSQRREAMGKLALTEQNLARIADVIGEVSRQIGSLRRQAAKALRYKRLSHRLRHLSLALSAWQHGQLAVAIGELGAKVAALRAEAEARRAGLDAQQAGLEEKKALRSRLSRRVQEAQEAVFELRSQKEQSENAANLAGIRGTGLQERIQSSRDNLGEFEMQIREVTAQVDSGAQDKQLQLNLLGSSDSVFQQRNRELAVADGELAKVERELQQAKFELLQLDSTVARLRTECSAFEVDQKTSIHRHEALSGELREATAQSEAAARTAAEASSRVAEALAAKGAAAERTAAAQAEAADATREFREGQRRLQEIDRQLAQRGARLKLLQQLQERWEGFGEGAKAVLQGRLDDELAGTKVVPVTRGLKVRPEHGRAVEALLGSAAEAIEVSDLATARKILSRLERDQVGSAILRVAEFSGADVAPADLPPGLERASSALAGAEDAHPARALLASCYIAADLGQFLEYWRAHPEFSFLAVATAKGEVVDRRGWVSGGYASPKKHAGSIVQREIDLRETEAALAEDQSQHDAQKGRIETLTARLTAAEQALEDRRGETLSATQAVAAAQAEDRTARRTAEDAAARLLRLEQDRVAVEKARDEAQARWDKALADLAQGDGSSANQRRRIEELEARIAVVRTERDVKRDSLAQARLELAERRQKVEVLDRGLGEMERRRQQLTGMLADRQREIETWTDQVAELEREVSQQKSRAAQLAETLAVSQEQVEKIRAELVGVEKEIDALDAARAEVHREADRAFAELGGQEVKLAEARQRAGFLEEEALHEFQANLLEVDWKRMVWLADGEPEGIKPLDLDEEEEPAEAPTAQAAAAPDAEAPPEKPRPRRSRPKRAAEPTPEDLAALAAPDWDAVKPEIDALRQRLGGIGAVNLVAIEEYAELKQRHDFLKTQSDDLIRAKAELVQAIDEINLTSQKQFEVTFAQIRKNFEYTFQTLFGGGRAELEIVQAEDILESGIEIVAQPPGTKLKSVTLLSGGQKTLTAVALLFALYLVKPSPFCLLDELDAPLDESNIGRFTELLKKFVRDSQFIIITHNKRTVAAAGAIYGVTMEERGVSKTVSMRFNHERGEAEAHPASTVADAVRAAKPPDLPDVPAATAANGA